MAAAATVARTILCEQGQQRSGGPTQRDPPLLSPPRLRPAAPSPEGGKIMLQPRLCTLRSYGSGTRDAVVRTARPREDAPASHFFASLAEYIESSRRSQDFEIVSGRFAMMVFVAAMTVETVTGNSLFKKLELQQIAEAVGVCVAVVAFAATFAWFSSARTSIGRMFTIGCNSFVDSLIDNIVDGLFYESELNDRSDEI